jgi:hypothetical protein
MAEKPKKLSRLKARLPRGLEDRGLAAMLTGLAMAALTGEYLVMKYSDYFLQEALRASQRLKSPVDSVGVANGG